MKNKIECYGFVILIFLIFISGCSIEDINKQYTKQIPTESNPTNYNSVSIANWNLQIFGDSKASNPTLMNTYASIISNYDIIFIQEIRDSDGSSFNQLCSMLPNYQCSISSRAGRSTSKEQYGIIYKNGIILKNLKDFNPELQSQFERPPIEATFEADNFTFSVLNMHTKPEDTSIELDNLDDLANTINGDVVVLGDFNEDGNYYNGQPIIFENWNKIIPDGCDSTVAESINCYDRIYINQEMSNHYLSYGIYNSITSDISDHYLIWIRLKVD